MYRLIRDYWDGPLPDPDLRTMDDMRVVLANPECPTPDRPLYYMYRNLARTDEDRAWLDAQDLRYDITVIPPGALCGEFVKTKGHYHPQNPAGVEYPELYQVLSGQAHFLFQHRQLTDMVVCTAREGQAVLVPPGYGHVTINPGREVVVMANLVSSRFASDYEFFEGMQGAAYYECTGGVWRKNPRYAVMPGLRFTEPPQIPELCLAHGSSIYLLLSREGCLDYLNHPERHLEQLTGFI
ncbi:MAG TPA: glucose-6-phosphate isomerase family protein [Methanomicrobiales archaeon]|nr:glucose-6-phosphate isomerase family protein [Methanomicrobiales archaeon]